MGCDSVITVHLTIKSSGASVINPVVCNSYVSPSGKYTWVTSGTYQDTILAANGCNIFLDINLTVNHSNSSTFTTEACDSFVSPSGKIWTSGGAYIDTVPNSMGCDSVIFIALTINNSSSSTFDDVACNSYMSPSGKSFTTSGIYMDTIANGAGCDSTMTIDLTINHSTDTTYSVTSCDSIVAPSGNKVWYASGHFMDTIANSSGCDSVLSINLTINQSNSGSDTITSCDDFLWAANGQTYTASGVYTTTLYQ
ncbi:MAG: hypothetical protein U5L96_16675 [Owenweeksia sp.]|nr:hypothetical protein [Owenweeksia sp.]